LEKNPEDISPTSPAKNKIRKKTTKKSGAKEENEQNQSGNYEKDIRKCTSDSKVHF